MKTFVDILYGWLPTVFAVVSLIVSVLVSWKTRRLVHFCLSFGIFAAAFFALFSLYRIFCLGAYASYMPHFIIAGTFVISAVQGFSYLSRGHDAA
jgi:hypothetical protein